MWLHPDLQTIVQDGEQYTSPRGVRYPGNFPKAEISSLLPVTLVAPGNTQFQDATPDGVEFVGGVWRQKWTITNWLQPRIDAFNAATALATADAAALGAARTGVVVTYLMTHTPAEIGTYIQTNVTSLATAKNILADLAIAVSVLGKQVLR